MNRPAATRACDEPDDTRLVALAIPDMWCGGCARSVQARLAGADGVEDAAVSFVQGEGLVRYDPSRTDPEALAALVVDLGYTAAPWEGSGRDAAAAMQAVATDLARRTAVAVVLGMWVMMLTVGRYASAWGPGDPALERVLALGAGLFALPVVAWAGEPLWRMGWRSARAGVPGMDTLVSLGAVAATAMSWWVVLRGGSEVYFDTAAMIVTLTLLGRWLEARVRRAGGSAVDRFRSLVPDTAWLVEDEGLREVPTDWVEPGAVVEIRPGARVGVDGEILSGRSHLDRSLLTGEPDPVSVGPGAVVEAGTTNLQGTLRIRVTQPPGARRLDRIVAAVQRYLSTRAPLQALADRLAAWLVPGVLVLALGTVLGHLVAGVDVRAAVEVGLSVLVITCPCALGLATPLALAQAARQASGLGVLFRDGEALERAAGVDAVVFDKTGTLTEGRPRVRRVWPATGVDEATVRSVAARAEAGSEHPLARALRRDDAEGARAEGTWTAVPGQGVRHQTLEGTVLRVGRRSWLAREGVGGLLGLGPADDGVLTGSAPDEAGLTVVYVARDGEALGALGLGDALRPEAATVVARLHEASMDVGLLSGDGAAACGAVGRALGLDPTAVVSRATPEDKARSLQDRRARRQGVAFVGDGLNDGPALAAAHLGVAVSGATDLALDAAHLVLMQGGVARLPEALALARRTVRVMKGNLAWAFAYNLLALPLAVAGQVHPLVAVAAMAASSLSVTLWTVALGRAQTSRDMA